MVTFRDASAQGSAGETVNVMTVQPVQPVPTFRNCRLPDVLYYDVERDVWAQTLPDGHVRLGLTDPGQTLAGKIQVVSFPKPVGRHLPAEKALALLESAKWLAPMRIPMTAEIVAVNEELLLHPLLVNLDPYGRGWVIEVAVDGTPPWPTGQRAFDEYKVRLQRTFRSVAGVNDDFWCVHCNDWDEVKW